MRRRIWGRGWMRGRRVDHVLKGVVQGGGRSVPRQRGGGREGLVGTGCGHTTEAARLVFILLLKKTGCCV